LFVQLHTPLLLQGALYRQLIKIHFLKNETKKENMALNGK
jgi:hypothetical protein